MLVLCKNDIICLKSGFFHRSTPVIPNYRRHEIMVKYFGNWKKACGDSLSAAEEHTISNTLFPSSERFLSLTSPLSHQTPWILSFHITWGSYLSRPTVPLSGIGSALALLRWLVLVFRQPLPTDVLHYWVLRSLSGPKDVLDQRACPAWLQLHRLQVSWSQFTAQQIGLDLRTERDRMRLSISFLSNIFLRVQTLI